ncbi:MAG: DNA-directed RNA polymerase subunit omega [Nitrospiraceae bacterium]|nr:DNA-directed RNA polymerase subunit omega [Nitrospiraceae bacterium]MDA8325574.1 DNA-directed RNA polymerase subunit omega [Nitrospiraceae bacterium]
MDIISLPVKTEKKNIDSRFRLVAIASQRAKDLSLGAKPKLPSKYKKVASQGILEAVENVLEFLTGEEARTALEEAKKLDMRRLLETKKREARVEELTELERDLKVYLHEKEEKSKEGLEELFVEKNGEEEPPKE